MKNIPIAKQLGFLLPAAIFLLVILAGLGAYALNITSVQNNSAIQDVQSTRAYHASRAGIEWAAYQILQTSPLTSIPSCPTTTLNIDGFSIAVSCTEFNDIATGNEYLEQGGDNKIRLYEVVSTATFGTLNTQSYIERRIDVTLSKCVANGATICQ